MTILSSISKEKSVEIIKMLDKEISIIEREISILNSMKEKLKKRIKFLKDIKNDRIPLESYG
jgi:prefoldin subunit 5